MGKSTRAEFDAIADGWGGDCIADLAARCELLSEFFECNIPLSPAELKIITAMRRRLCELGGIPSMDAN